MSPLASRDDTSILASPFVDSVIPTGKLGSRSDLYFFFKNLLSSELSFEIYDQCETLQTG